MPLMDWRLVAFAHALPTASKLGGGYTKRILRDAIAGLVPEEVRLRRFKMGFNSPLVEWFNGRLAGLVRQAVAHPLWQGSPFWDGPRLGAEVLAKTDGRAWRPDDWELAIRTWTRINLVLWQRLFLQREDRGALAP
jgi:asparagine synthase (glutamine-hydrolysing)